MGLFDVSKPVQETDLSLRQWCLVLAAEKVPHNTADDIVAAAKIFEAYLIAKPAA